MGPFEPNQSGTIANSLRRTLLSELYGLAITSVEIEGASHEYTNLKGVNESVLDIILNLKHLVLKKTFYSSKPLLGYLRVQGPANVYASDLRLPPFVQCVDPNHLIATLEEDGVLTMRVLIQYGHKWLSPPNHFFTPVEKPAFTNVMSSVLGQKKLKMRPMKKEKDQDKKLTKLSKKEQKEKEKEEKEEKAKNDEKEAEVLNNLNSLPRKNLKNLLNFHFIKRRFIFNQVKSVGFILSKTYMKILSGRGFHLLNRVDHLQEKINNKLSRWKIKKRYKAFDLKKIDSPSAVELIEMSGSTFRSSEDTSDLKKKPPLTQAKKAVISKTTSKPITIDAVFNPVNKVNFTIEHSDYKSTLELLNHSEEVSEFYKMIRASNLRTLQFSPQLSPYNNNKKRNRLKRNRLKKSVLKKNALKSLPDSTHRKPLKKKVRKQKGLTLLNDAKTSSLNMFLDYQKELNLLKNNTPKDNIILEIWTNGSLHPREALYQTFSNLLHVFSKLNEITPFLNVLTHFAKLPSRERMTKTMRDQWGPALKQIKTGKIETSLIPSLIPVTSESYLATYMTPHFRDFRTILKTDLPLKSIKLKFKKSIKSKKVIKSTPIKEIKPTTIKAIKLSLIKPTPIKVVKPISIKPKKVIKPTSIKAIKPTPIKKQIIAKNPDLVIKQLEPIPITVTKEIKLKSRPAAAPKQTEPTPPPVIKETKLKPKPATAVKQIEPTPIRTKKETKPAAALKQSESIPVRAKKEAKQPKLPPQKKPKRNYQTRVTVTLRDTLD
jgi:DNA-directed RNA polymerase alpha subunit